MVPKEHVKDEEITNAIQRFGLFALEGQYQRDITKAGATNKEFKTCKSYMTLRKDIKIALAKKHDVSGRDSDPDLTMIQNEGIDDDFFTGEPEEEDDPAVTSKTCFTCGVDLRPIVVDPKPAVMLWRQHGDPRVAICHASREIA